MILPRLAGRITRRAARRQKNGSSRRRAIISRHWVSLMRSAGLPVGGFALLFTRTSRWPNFATVASTMRSASVQGEGGALAGKLLGDGGTHELADVGDEDDLARELHAQTMVIDG